MKYIVSLALLVSIVALPNVISATTPTSITVTAAPRADAAMAEEILKYVNDYRKKKGLRALSMNAAITAEAQKHSENMAARRVSFGHTGFQQRMKRISPQINGTGATAENVAYGSTSAREVVDRWLKSPNHKQNIEGPYNLTGIGIATDKNGTLYFTQIFAAN